MLERLNGHAATAIAVVLAVSMAVIATVAVVGVFASRAETRELKVAFATFAVEVTRQHAEMLKAYREATEDITYYLSLGDAERAKWRLPPSPRIVQQRETARLMAEEAARRGNRPPVYRDGPHFRPHE